MQRVITRRNVSCELEHALGTFTLESAAGTYMESLTLKKASSEDLFGYP